MKRNKFLRDLRIGQKTAIRFTARISFHDGVCVHMKRNDSRPIHRRRGKLYVMHCGVWLRGLTALCCLLVVGAPTLRAGLYLSSESYADLPSQWRGFLLDQRTLRNIAVVPKAGADENPARTHYLQEAAKLEKKNPRNADDKADLGAMYIRLGDAGKAVELLRAAQREHPNHFFIAANLGTAWHMQGNLAQAADALREAVRLAPGKHQAAEQLHLKLVQQRMRAPRGGPADLDDLFGVRYGNDQGAFEPGKLAAAEKKKLPTRAAALAQQLALWLPADGMLLWQLGELANAYGDIRTAASLLDGCVVQFGMNHPELRRRRQALREAVDGLPKLQVGDKAQHEDKHAGTLAFRSKRPLVSRLDAAPLPPVSETGVNELPWQLFADTIVDTKFRPTFPKYLQELAGRKVALNGFIQPLGDDPEMTGFMFIEYPIGCWYCEMPDTVSIVYVELPPGKTAAYQRGLVRVVGRLTLNRSDPEDFLYAIRDARVGGVD